MGEQWRDMATAPAGTVRLKTDRGELMGMRRDGAWWVRDIYDPTDTFVPTADECVLGWRPV